MEKNNLKKAIYITKLLQQLAEQCKDNVNKRRFVQLTLDFIASLIATFSIDLTEDFIIHTQLIDKNYLEKSFKSVLNLLNILYYKLQQKIN